ncbi:unnamed protein product [Timema podura]|uniref:Uncharacterized protein n=1 Tax=Timema podura TaxID=61482 RepID=A0ABN7P0N7_TIMPD|nr:unnamed protein product [Timema podura]
MSFPQSSLRPTEITGMKRLIQASGLDDKKRLDPNQRNSTSASSTPSNSSKISSGRSSNRECLSEIVGQEVGEASLSWLGSDNTKHRGTIPKQSLPPTRCEEGPIVNLSHKDLNERLPNTWSASSITQSSSGDSGTKDCMHPDETSTDCRINETYSLGLQTPVCQPKHLRSLQDPANIDEFYISGKQISLARMRRRNMVKTNNDTLTRKNITLHGETKAQEESVKIFKEANDIRNKEKSTNARGGETSEFSSSKGQGEPVLYKDVQNATKIENGCDREVGDYASDCSHSPMRKYESSLNNYETYLHRKELNAQFPDKKHSLEDLEGAGEGCCQEARWQENPPPDEEECPSLNSVLISDVSDEFVSCHGRICELIMNFFFAPKKIIAFQEYPQFS